MKISLANLDKILDRCTKKEIDLILYIGQFQDTRGVISGLHYKRVLRAINVCKSTFYKLLYGLEAKDVIKINYFSEHSYWEVQLIDNVFMGTEDYKKGYFKLNYEILHSEKFLNLTKSEKVIVINLLKIKDFHRDKIKLTLKKIIEWTGKSEKSARKFLDTLSEIFTITFFSGSVLIDCGYQLESTGGSEIDIWLGHLINYRLERLSLESIDAKAFKDTIKVFKQYRIKAANLIMELVDKSLNFFAELAPKYINKQAQQI